MGKVLADLQFTPDKILSSPARRARQTAELLAKACNYKESIEWHDSFYEGSSDDLLSALRRLPDVIERALLVGHNPAMEETAAALLIGAEAKEQEDLAIRMAIRMPTAALMCLDLPVMTWARLEPGSAILRWFLIPKLVKALTKS
jgi:phosphohistidine phosphatase